MTYGHKLNGCVQMRPAAEPVTPRRRDEGEGCQRHL